MMNLATRRDSFNIKSGMTAGIVIIVNFDRVLCFDSGVDVGSGEDLFDAEVMTGKPGLRTFAAGVQGR
jgi:hypothetical protein